MAAEVTALQPLRQAPGPSPITPEQRYWRGFRNQQLIPSPHSNPITHISNPPPSPTINIPSQEVFAVTSGSRVQVFSTRTRKLVKTIGRFGIDDVAHCGEIRRDGRIIVAGGDSGAVQVFDLNSRAILKTWREHKQPVWTTKWDPLDLTTLLSASDDRTLRLWDLPSQNSTITFTGHQDYVRAAAFMPGQASNLILSGSYDQTVRLWDRRAPEQSIMIFKHAAPIESVLPLPSGTSILASADNQISVLDLVAAKPIEIIKSHQKTVTCLSLASNGSRVVSGGLDGHMKILETTNWSVVAASKYSSPILSLNVISSGQQQDDRHLAVGLQSGVLSLKTRLAGQQKLQERQKAKEMQAIIEGKVDEFDKKNKRKRTSGLEKRLRGLQYDGYGTDIMVEGNERRNSSKSRPWEKALRKTQYAKALDLVLSEHPSNPVTVLTLLTALSHRSALRAALRNRNETTLQPVLRWLARHITDPRHVIIITRLSTLVLEMYADQLGQSKAIDGLVERLHERVRGEVDGAQTAEGCRGMLELVMASG